jgi:hypothetical protein
MIKKSMSCKESDKLISKKMDQELSLSEKIALKFHLAICASCKMAGQNYESFRNIFKKHPIREDVFLSEQAKKRILEELRSQKSKK